MLAAATLSARSNCLPSGICLASLPPSHIRLQVRLYEQKEQNKSSTGDSRSRHSTACASSSGGSFSEQLQGQAPAGQLKALKASETPRPRAQVLLDTETRSSVDCELLAQRQNGACCNSAGCPALRAQANRKLCARPPLPAPAPCCRPVEREAEQLAGRHD
jgi:hypothetical protein